MAFISVCLACLEALERFCVDVCCHVQDGCFLSIFCLCLMAVIYHGTYVYSCDRHGDQVRHYHIKKDPESHFYISDRHRFTTVSELVNYHQHNSGGSSLQTVHVQFEH